MHRMFAVVLIGTLTSLPLAAGAQAGEEPDPTEYRFDDHGVLGDTVGPHVEVLHARRGAGSGSLIRVRDHFVGEMLKDVEDL